MILSGRNGRDWMDSMPIDGVIMLVMLLLGMASSAGLAWCARGTRDREKVRREIEAWCGRERWAMDKTEAERVAFWLKKYREIGIGGEKDGA